MSSAATGNAMHTSSAQEAARIAAAACFAALTKRLSVEVAALNSTTVDRDNAGFQSDEATMGCMSIPSQNTSIGYERGTHTCLERQFNAGKGRYSRPFFVVELSFPKVAPPLNFLGGRHALRSTQLTCHKFGKTHGLIFNETC